MWKNKLSFQDDAGLGLLKAAIDKEPGRREKERARFENEAGSRMYKMDQKCPECHILEPHRG